MFYSFFNIIYLPNSKFVFTFAEEKEKLRKNIG